MSIVNPIIITYPFSLFPIIIILRITYPLSFFILGLTRGYLIWRSCWYVCSICYWFLRFCTFRRCRYVWSRGWLSNLWFSILFFVIRLVMAISKIRIVLKVFIVYAIRMIIVSWLDLIWRILIRVAAISILSIARIPCLVVFLPRSFFMPPGPS